MKLIIEVSLREDGASYGGDEIAKAVIDAPGITPPQAASIGAKAIVEVALELARIYVDEEAPTANRE